MAAHSDSAMEDHLSNEEPEQPQRRRRPPLSCTTCRRRKLKCDRSLPCGQCVRSKTTDECVFTGAQPETNRQMSPPLSRPRPSAASERKSGMFVFDSKMGPNSSRVSKRRSDELTEMRQRLKALESLLKTNVQTPDTSVGDVYSEVDSASTSENVGVDDRVRFLPDSSFRGKKAKTRYFGRSHYTTTVSFVSAVLMVDVKFAPANSVVVPGCWGIYAPWSASRGKRQGVLRHETVQDRALVARNAGSSTRVSRAGLQAQ